MVEETDGEEMTLPQRFNRNCCQLFCVCVFWGRGGSGLGIIVTARALSQQ